MTKYWQIAVVSWQNGFVYRASLFLWRFRQFLSAIMSLTVWNVLFLNQNLLFGYTREVMIEYIFITAVIQSFVLSSALNNLAGQIYSGEISSLLLKPVNFFGYMISQELADKLRNFFFVLVELCALWVIFKPELSWPQASTLILFAMVLILATTINFLISLLFSSLGFWSPDTWGPRFIFFMLIDFTAGKLFPLDILPTALQKIIYLTPFPYLAFWPGQIFLGRIAAEPSKLVAPVVWLIGLLLLNRIVWQRGWKIYQASGQ